MVAVSSMFQSQNQACYAEFDFALAGAANAQAEEDDDVELQKALQV